MTFVLIPFRLNLKDARAFASFDLLVQQIYKHFYNNWFYNFITLQELPYVSIVTSAFTAQSPANLVENKKLAADDR